MPTRDLVVIGASAGGVEALRVLARGLPTDLPASVLVVLHTLPNYPTQMPNLIEIAGPLPAGHGVDLEPLRRGRIYIAPPDRHMAVEDGVIRILEGPKENWCRPSVDTLFRSAAVAHGPRVLGVVLSGTRSDGVAGASAVKRCGGKLIVQSLEEGPTSSMPMGVRNATTVDSVLPIEEIAGRIADLVGEQVSANGRFPVPEKIRLENRIMLKTEDSGDVADRLGNLEKIGKLTMLTCPQCHGSLWEIEDPTLLRYRCHVGHAFSSEGLDEGQKESIENALWSAARELEERAVSTRGLAELARRRKDPAQARAFEERSRLAGEHVRMLAKLAAEIGASLRAPETPADS
jgi:two-component system chemotaxis response regulator CheB